MTAAAKTTAAPKTVTVKVGKKTFGPAVTNASLITDTEGKFDFVTAATVPHDAHVVTRMQQPVTPLSFPAKAVTRVARDRFDADDMLLNFIKANGWEGLKTQKILDSARAKGYSASMARVNRLLHRDSKGNALPAAEPVKAEA
jgi:hypothetical protein